MGWKTPSAKTKIFILDCKRRCRFADDPGILDFGCLIVNGKKSIFTHVQYRQFKI